jgi:hypothetical protein
MPTTKPAPSFDSISLADLTFVQGGCGKKKCQCPPPAPPQAAPAPSGGTAIETNVSITGYGQ